MKTVLPVYDHLITAVLFIHCKFPLFTTYHNYNSSSLSISNGHKTLQIFYCKCHTSILENVIIVTKI